MVIIKKQSDFCAAPFDPDKSIIDLGRQTV